MAPKTRSTVKFLLLILTLYVIAMPAPVRAASGRADGQHLPVIREHVIKFYLDPTLVPDRNVARVVLAKYVDDMNFVLQKNTNRRLVFHAETGIILTSSQPHSNSATPPLPVDGFEIWVHATRTSQPASYGGYAGIDLSGAGVLAGLKWTRLYDPDALSGLQVQDYWTQINNMLHELAHVFGAGYGEYYGLASVQDTTGVAPLLNINVYDPGDSFWSDKADFKTDPLLWNPAQAGILGQTPSRKTLLNFVQYSSLTAAIMSGGYRNAAPSVDLSQIGIKIVDEAGAPLDSANVKIWSVAGGHPYQAQLIVNGLTDSAGELRFAWGGLANPHNSYDFLRLIKVYKDGYTAEAAYVSIYDTDIAKLVDSSPVFEKEITLREINPRSTATFADVSTDNFALSSIERLYNAGVTGGCSTAPLLYCPDEVVTRAQMAIFLERGIHGSMYSPPAVGGSTGFGDVQPSHWAAPWIKQLANDGITSGCGDGNYCPDASVTRAQMAIFLLRSKYGSSYVPPSIEGSTVFSDVPTTHWAAAWIKQLAAEGITGGCGNGNYCPHAPVTRAQMAVFLVRTMNLP